MAKADCRSTSPSRTRKSVYLWEFLFGLLEDDECTSIISWVRKHDGTFSLNNTDELAKLWGTIKNRPKMDKSKLIRAMRTYYNRGMLKKVKGHKAVYQFIIMPYETDVLQQGNSSMKSGQVGSPGQNVNDITEMKSVEAHEKLADNCKTWENSRNATEGCQEQTGDACDEWSIHHDRADSSSEYSSSSESSTKSFDELHEDSMLNRSTFGDMTETMHFSVFPFNQDSDVSGNSNENIPHI